MNDENLVFGYWNEVGKANFTFKSWIKNIQVAGIYAAIHLKPDIILYSSTEQLSKYIAQVFKLLFPFVLLSLYDDPVPAIIKYLDFFNLKSKASTVKPPNNSSFNQLNLNLTFEATARGKNKEISETINPTLSTEVEQLAAVNEQLEAEEYFTPTSSEEAKKRITRAIAQRQGQSKFRQSLLEAYNYRCAITGCDAQEALEAAHIIPYCESENNHPSNGLLLRADLHTLLDLN